METCLSSSQKYPGTVDVNGKSVITKEGIHMKEQSVDVTNL